MLKLFSNQFRVARVCRNFSTATFTVGKVIEGWDSKLKAAGVLDAEFNIKCIVAHVLNQKFNKLTNNYHNETLSAEQCKDFERLCTARCARMPLQHILGEWDFMGITLKTLPSVFIPRPETEEFVRKVIEAYRDAQQVNMLEVGCGTGAMSLAILHALPQVRSTAIERSRAATELARENAKLLKLDERFTAHHHTMETNKFLPAELQDKHYDLIISNPPYVRTSEFQHLQPEVVVYENVNALDGGPDGLRVARVVLSLACQHLRTNGHLWLELGEDHPPLIKTIISQHYEGRLRYIGGYKDQYKRERFVAIEKVDMQKNS